MSAPPRSRRRRITQSQLASNPTRPARARRAPANNPEGTRDTCRLEHYHFDTFTVIPVEPRDEVASFDRATLEVQFRLGAGGEVEGAKILDQEFRKVPGKK